MMCVWGQGHPKLAGECGSHVPHSCEYPSPEEHPPPPPPDAQRLTPLALGSLVEACGGPARAVRAEESQHAGEVCLDEARFCQARKAVAEVPVRLLPCAGSVCWGDSVAVDLEVSGPAGDLLSSCPCPVAALTLPALAC